MKTPIIVILFLLQTILCIAQVDSIYLIHQDKQVKTLQGICTQVKNVNSTIKQNSASIDNISESIKINLETHSDKIIEALKQKKKQS